MDEPRNTTLHLRSQSNFAVLRQFTEILSLIGVASPMSNRIEETNIPAGTTIRTGAPAERPQEALNELIKLFSQKQNVISARLGLMEMIYPDGKSEFTYTIGMQCTSDEQATIQQAAVALQSAPAGRWPISIFLSQSIFHQRCNRVLWQSG